MHLRAYVIIIVIEIIIITVAIFSAILCLNPLGEIFVRIVC